MPTPTDTKPAPVVPAPLTGHRAEENFVNEFSERLRSGATGTLRGRELEEHRESRERGDGKDGKRVAPKVSQASGTKPTVIINEGTDDAETEDDDLADRGLADDDTHEDDDEGEESVNAEGTEEKTPEGEEEAEGDDEKKEGEEGDKPEGETEDTDDAEVDDETAQAEKAEREAAAAFDATIKRHGFHLTMDDLPREARQIVQAKFKQMESAFTRAMQDARSYRTNEAKFRADQRFLTEHPDLVLYEMIQADPTLIDKVNAHADAAATDMGKESIKVVIKDKKRETAEAVDREVREVTERRDRSLGRADAIADYTRRMCDKLDIPFATVIKAVALELQQKPADQMDLSQAELDTIIKGEFQTLRNHSAKHRQRQQQETIQARTKDRRTASPAGRVRSGSPAVPGRQKPPKTEDDFIAHMERKRGAR